MKVAQIIENQTELPVFEAPVSEKKKADKLYEYELRYLSFASKRLRGATVRIVIRTKQAAKPSSLVSISRNAIRSSDFIPRNRKARKAAFKPREEETPIFQ